MEAIKWSEISYQPAAVPKLRMAQQSPRRDSLSSSRTGDSGYNSDPDPSLSPLAFMSPAYILYSSSAFTRDSSALFDVKEAVDPRRKQADKYTFPFAYRRPEGSKSQVTKQAEVTSQPKIIVDTFDDDVRNIKEQSDRQECHKAAPLYNLTDSQSDPKVGLGIAGYLHPNASPKERNSSIVSLSSTGSCDMYSNTDDNSDDEVTREANPSTLSKATLKTIDIIMRKIEVNLNYVAYLQHAGNQSSRAHKGSGSNPVSGRESSQGSGKRKTRADDGLRPDEPDDDGTSKRRRISNATTTEDSESGPKFACPFYKHDPNRYRNRRTCPGPGWPSVHRMKEHLYRSHAQPICCPRCYAEFDSDSELSVHLRAAPCRISAPQVSDGIDRETIKILRKRSPPLRLEEDKWRDTYQLLFPDVVEVDIPSPYYDCDPSTEGSRRFRRELLRRIRSELFATAEQEPGLLEQNLLRQVAGIILRCESALLASFHTTTERLLPITSRRVSSDFLQPDPRSSAPSTGQTPLSPRSTPTLGVHPAGQEAPQLDPYPDSFYFSTLGWVDWNHTFPPGNDMQTGSTATLSTPVYS